MEMGMGERIIREVTAPQGSLTYYKALHDIANQIHAAKNINEILINLKDQMLRLFDADRITIYVVDGKRKEIYSRFKAGNNPEEIRLPVSNKSIAGYTANNAETINILNAYDSHELGMINSDLSFDKSWDEKFGYSTKQILAVPIFYKKYVIGVLQLVNKRNGNRFSLEDQASAEEMASVLGIAFFNQKKLAEQRRKRTKFDYLIQNNIISERELEKAITIARQQGKPIESVFIQDLRVKKEEVGRSLAEYYNCEYVPFNANCPIPGDLLTKLKHSYLKTNLWVPLGREDGAVKILIDNPLRLDKIDSAKSLLPTGKYVYAVGLKEDILQFLEHFYGASQMKIEGSIDDILGKLDTGVEEDLEVGTEMLSENDSVIVQLVNKIITDAHRRNASDIHIEPYPGREGAEIRFRVDGICHRYQTVPYNYRRALVSRLKIMADLDISERRKPQDGKIRFKKYGSLDIEVRVASVPTVGGEEDIVLRLLKAGAPIPLKEMGINERDYNLLLNMASKPHGIILVVGPTGSGKTTTLHSVLAHINKPETKIWTAEDPVEITQRGLRQVQVLPKINFDFASALRSFLRADPDVIMVGEMRDHETASIGIEASLTGHLVLSTLHTNSAPETVVRLLDMGMDPFNFADALLGVLAQRLVRTFCKDCKEPYHPTRAEYDTLSRAYGRDFESLGFPYTDDLILHRANGCEGCGKTGYKGRVAITELLDGTDEMKALIQTKANADAIREQAMNDGMKTLMQDGIRKVFLGVTDLTQVRKVCIK
jgi:type II secretory ATPase GspE/PulE/Tfp pilus assembly ATPase PilB-like protein